MGFYSRFDALAAARLRLSLLARGLRREAPLLPYALAAIAGAALSRLPLSPLSSRPLIGVLLLALIAAFAVPRRVFLLLCGAALCFGWWRAAPAAPAGSFHDDEPGEYEVRMTGPVESGERRWRFSARLLARPDASNPSVEFPATAITVFGFGVPPDWADGSRIALTGTLRSAPSLRNFGVSPAAVQPVLTVKSVRLGRVIAPPMTGVPGLLRVQLAAALRALPLDETLAAAARGMLLGERGTIPPAIRGLHQRLSTFHLFVVSGLQFALAVLMAGAFVRLLGFSPRMADLAQLAFLLLYFSLLPGEVAVRRAACFGVLTLIARLCGRERPALNGWALALMGEIAVSPATLFGLGFQLSYLASLALILRAASATPAATPRGWRALAARAGRIFTMPLRVAAWLLPVQAALGPVPLLGPLANGWTLLCAQPLLFSLWFATLAQACGLARIARGIAPLANLSWRLLHAGLWKLDAPDWRVASGAWPLAASLVYIASLAFCQRSGRGRLFFAVAAAGLATAFWLPPAAKLPVRPVFEMLDAGQGDALLLGDGRDLLLMDGGRPAAGAAVVAALRARGIFRLRCAASHQDSDHAGGLPAVLNALHCTELLIPAGARRDPGFAPLLALARARGVPVRALAAGMRIPFGENSSGSVQRGRLDRASEDTGGALQILWPPPGAAESPNDRALVALWENRDFRLLLTGDIEARAENSLLAAGVPHAALLKVAHHGSKSSTGADFLDAVQPRLALISVGANNSYGHPSAAVLERLDPAALFRTDQNGGLRVTRRGDFLKVETAAGPTRWLSLAPPPALLE